VIFGRTPPTIVGVTSGGRVPHTTTNISIGEYFDCHDVIIQESVLNTHDYIKGDNSQLL